MTPRKRAAGSGIPLLNASQTPSGPSVASVTTGKSRRRGQAAPTNGTVPAAPGGAPAIGHASRKAAKAFDQLAESAAPRCLCGCGQPVTREFKPGHDARYKSQQIQKAIAGDETARLNLEHRGWTKFLIKAENAANTRAVRAERKEAKQSLRIGGFNSNHELLDVMKAAREVLIGLGRYGRAAGSHRVDISAANCQAIVDGTFDYGSAPVLPPLPPIYGQPGYDSGGAEVTRHIEPIRDKKTRDRVKAARAAEAQANRNQEQS